MAVTLRDLMTRALGYADFPRDSLDAEQQAQLIVDINDGLRELWELLIRSRQDIIHKVAPAISVVSGTESYDLPSDFYHALKLWWLEHSRRYRMERFSLDEMDGYPKPLQSGQVELWYAPELPRLRLKSDEVPDVIPHEWENYAALFAAVRLLDSEESDSSKWSQERDRMAMRIADSAEPRDEGEPQTISDVHGRWSGDPLRDEPTRRLRYRIMGSKIYFVEVEQPSGV